MTFPNSNLRIEFQKWIPRHQGIAFHDAVATKNGNLTFSKEDSHKTVWFCMCPSFTIQRETREYANCAYVPAEYPQTMKSLRCKWSFYIVLAFVDSLWRSIPKFFLPALFQVCTLSDQYKQGYPVAICLKQLPNLQHQAKAETGSPTPQIQLSSTRWHGRFLDGSCPPEAILMIWFWPAQLQRLNEDEFPSECPNLWKLSGLLRRL